ncbi:hypothetical protein D3C80_1477490 [compost metagenome]
MAHPDRDVRREWRGHDQQPAAGHRICEFPGRLFHGLLSAGQLRPSGGFPANLQWRRDHQVLLPPRHGRQAQVADRILLGRPGGESRHHQCADRWLWLVLRSLLQRQAAVQGAGIRVQDQYHDAARIDRQQVALR